MSESDPDTVGDWDAFELQYTHLRSEIEESIRNQARILGYGGTAISLLLGIGVWQSSTVLLVALPFISFFFIMLWNVEQTRMMRAGEFINFLEREVNDGHFENPSLLWEHWLRYHADRERNDIYNHHYLAQYSVLALFMLVITGSAVKLVMSPPAIMERWTVSALVVTYVFFLLVAIYLVVGTIRHENLENGVEEFLETMTTDGGD